MTTLCSAHCSRRILKPWHFSADSLPCHPLACLGRVFPSALLAAPVVLWGSAALHRRKKLTMVCGGTGITPMYQALQKMDEEGGDAYEAVLIYGNVSPDDMKRFVARIEKLLCVRWQLIQYS